MQISQKLKTATPNSQETCKGLQGSGSHGIEKFPAEKKSEKLCS